MSALGSDFPRTEFVRTPIRLINEALKEVSDHEQATANINSMTTANLVNVVLQVAHGLSGSKRNAPKVKTKDYLPFPNWEPESISRTKLDESTKKVLVALVKARKLPMHVFSSLMTPPDPST